MAGTGQGDCDREDGHPDGDFGCDVVANDDERSGVIGYGGLTTFPALGEESVLENDWDAEDDPITAVLYSQATHGYVTLNEDGSFTYQPEYGDQLTDSFQYQAFDGENYSDPATVTLNLSNPPAVANDDSYGPTEFSYGGGIEFNLGSVLTNDERVPANEDLIIDGHYTQPGNGSVSMDVEGYFTYTPNQGFVGTDSFTYQAYDHVSWGNSATVTITITNPSPVADDDAYAGGLDGSGEASFGSVLDNDSDPNDTWLEVADYSSASEGSVTVDPDGTIYYSAPSPEFTGIVTFTYRTWDHWTYSDPATVTLTITSPLMLSAPPVENSTAASVDADAVRRFLVAAGERWHEAGVSRHIVGKALESLTVTVTDLPGSQLAGIHGSVIFVDHNAAGHGWFVDATPGDDAEFPRATTGGLRAGTNSPAYEHADLLTAVMHEMGHWFGLPHSDRPGNIMHEELDLGTRVNPSAVDAAIVELIFSARRRRS